DSLIRRCLRKDPAERFASARELAAALRAVAQETTPVDTPWPPPADTAPTVPPSRVPEAAGVPQQSQAPSVAVLPFLNMSADADNEYFSDGLAEELIQVLSKIENLNVASRTSSFAFKDKNEDVRRIGQQLGVRTVLEGSVRKAGNRLRISAKLINVGS